MFLLCIYVVFALDVGTVFILYSSPSTPPPLLFSSFSFMFPCLCVLSCCLVILAYTRVLMYCSHDGVPSVKGMYLGSKGIMDEEGLVALLRILNGRNQ